MEDLEPGLPIPTVRSAAWDVPEGTESLLLANEDGIGIGVTLLPSASTAEQLRTVADQLQEWVIEQLWSTRASAIWPACPIHPGTHPLKAHIVDDRAVWMCTQSSRVVADVGKLLGAGATHEEG